MVVNHLRVMSWKRKFMTDAEHDKTWKELSAEMQSCPECIKNKADYLAKIDKDLFAAYNRKGNPDPNIWCNKHKYRWQDRYDARQRRERREHLKNFLKRNPGYFRKYGKTYRQENAEYFKNYRKINKERLKEYNREYRKNDAKIL